MAAFLTVSRLDEPISSIDDLAGQFKVKYATLSSGASKSYFERMRDIESRFYDIWTRMSLDLKLSEYERSRLAVWDYPLSDKYTNMWSAMEKSKFPENFKEAIDRIKNRPGDEDFAFIGDATMIKYAALTDCKLWQVCKFFKNWIRLNEFVCLIGWGRIQQETVRSRCRQRFQITKQIIISYIRIISVKNTRRTKSKLVEFRQS